MKTNKSSASFKKSTSTNLIDLYTRIPDYSEVQHLGQSDFINTLERLKEEFRQCRASLYNEEFCSDSEYLAGKSSPICNNGRSKTTDDFLFYSSKYGKGDGDFVGSSYGKSCNNEGGDGKIAMKINNHNFTNTATNQANNEDESEQGTMGTGRRGQYLSIKSCELHRTPYRTTSASSLINPSRYIEAYGRSSLLEDRGKNECAFQDDYDDDEDDYDDEVGGEGYVRRNDREWSVDSDNSDISISKWSSSPELYRSRSRNKEFFPPSNTGKRLLQRKPRNNSAPSVAFKEEEDVPKQTFKANPVPAHVYKPLYEFIMLKNQRRSDRIREQSKRRLLSQMKPFSFCKDSNRINSHSNAHGIKLNRSAESLNNTKPLKKRRNDHLSNIKTNNNRLSSGSTAIFKAKPAPPRTKALLSAIRQKEQQEYRELKKRLRAETLLKNASLPPSMAAREKRIKLTNAKIDEVLQDYQKSFSSNKKNRMHRNFRETSTGTEDTGLLTDDDRMTEDEYSGATVTKKITTIQKPFKFSQRNPRKFTSFGTSRHSAAATGVFESSSNDNLASRLRYEAAKKKEEIRMQREEEEMLKLIKAERRRQKLRDSHLHAWQHACSYSAEQDIAMRRQLRHAASILERETYVRDMSCMLSRVRSAPLLLEGGDRLERKQEPCKKHREEFRKFTSSSGTDDRPWNKLSTPRLYTSSWSGQKHGRGLGSKTFASSFDRYGDEKSETVALAEGSLSNSDNESCENDDNDNNSDRGYHGKRTGSLETDTEPSDLEQEREEHANNNDNENETHQNYCVSGKNGEEELEKEHALSTDNEISDEAEEEGQNEVLVNDIDAREEQSQEN